MKEQYSIDLSRKLKGKNQDVLDKGIIGTNGKRLEKIYEITTALMESLVVHDICERIMDSLFDYFTKIDGGAILTTDHHSVLSKVVSRSREKSGTEGLPYSRTIMERVLQEARAVIISDLRESNQDKLSDSIKMRRVKSLMCVPLISRGGIQGLIYLHSLDALQTFQEEDLHFVAALSTPAALAIENASLYSRSRQMEEALQTARQDLEQQIQERTAELTRANRQLQELSITDGLTGLHNHRHLIRTLESEYKRAVRYRRNFALMMVDVDHFKQVNDTYGHPCGDFVLRSIARLFREAVRTTDIVARYGGDEMAVVLLETGKEMGVKVSEKLRREVEKYPFEWEGKAFRVTVSIGVASVLEKGIHEWNDVLKAADKALYQAKDGKRNAVVASVPEGETVQLDLFGKTVS